MVPTDEVLKKSDPEIRNLNHICQLIRGEKKCLSILHFGDSKQRPSIVRAWSYKPKSRDQIWEVKLMDTGHVVNDGFCLGYSKLVGRIFAKNSCIDRDNNGELSKTLDWSFVPIRGETGGKKCIPSKI